MKKSTAFLAASAATSLMGLLPAEVAHAASVACTAGTVAAPVFCDIAAGSYLAKALKFTGSNGVLLSYEDATAGFGACAVHIAGAQAFGLTTQGGSMEVKTGTADIITNPGANSGAGGCD